MLTKNADNSQPLQLLLCAQHVQHVHACSRFSAPDVSLTVSDNVAD